MKRLSILLGTATFLMMSVNAVAQDPNIRQTSNTNEKQPYKITYSDLKFGKADYSKVILNAWKAYDNNMLDAIVPIIADTVIAVMPDGTMIKGKEAFVKGLKTYRGGFASVSSMVDACTTLKSPEDPNHEVTLIWGIETATNRDGTVQKLALHEVWFFNKDGMVSRFYQYATPFLEKR